MNQSIESVEMIRPLQHKGKFKAVIFDFDGTISLIREGWQQIMVSYFVEELSKAAEQEEEKMIKELVTEFVEKLTGKQTIYQCIELAEQIKKYGGKAKDPKEYKYEYLDRLWERIKGRVQRLEDKQTDPSEWVVPGSFELLSSLQDRGMTLYLASGTDEKYVVHEAECLGVAQYFNGGIYGAQDDYKNFSKAKVIQQIIQTHQLSGKELLGFGDGYVEIENVKYVQGTAIGVASNETLRNGIDQWKRKRLIEAGADLIISDFRDLDALLKHI